MKKVITILFIIMFPTLIFGQTITVKVDNVQNFEHPLMKTDDAILLDKITYLNAGNTNVYFIFDFQQKKLERIIDGIKESLPIKNIRFIGEMVDIDVDYGNNKIVNYFIKDENEKIMLCRWIKDNKIKGWCDNNVEIKKEN